MSPDVKIGRAPCVLAGAFCVLAALSWQALTVRFNFGGNWTALYCTGDVFPVPPSLASENVYRFHNTAGWDGQFYHYIAHDPLLRRDLWKSIDAPRLRYRRILIPAAAHLLAAGRPGWIDAAYRAAVLVFFFLGAYWLSRLAVFHGRSPAWGLAFLLVPGAIVSLDRLAIDIALSAFCVGFVLLIRGGRAGWPLYALLVFAALARDTGLLLAGGYALWLLLRAQWRRAAVFATAILPALVWYAYVGARTAPIRRASLALPLTGALDRILHPRPYPFSYAATVLVRSLDALAVCGVLLAFFLALWLVRRGLAAPERAVMLLFAAVGIFVWLPGDWADAFDYGRIFSPLLVLLALEFPGARWRWGLAPLLLALPRLCLQMSNQALGVLRGLL